MPKRAENVMTTIGGTSMRQDFHRDTPATSGTAPLNRWLRRLALAAALLVSVGGTAPAYSAGGDILWQRSDALAGKQEPKAMAADSRGNTVMTGYQSISGGINDDYYTIKLKADGSIAWRATFDKAGGQDQATAIVIDGADNVIVTGFAWNGLNNDIHTVKYDGATGAVLWQHTLNGAANGNDYGTAITVDGLNNVYIGGYSQDAGGNNTFIIAKYAPTGPNPDGSPAWTTIADGAVMGINRVNSIAAGGGIVAVTGQTWNGTAMDMLTVALNSSGERVWERRYSTGSGLSCIGRYVKFDNAGNVIITGSAENGLDVDIYTAKYNGATGAIMWEKTCNGAYDDEPNGLAIGTNGSVYVTGYTWTLTAQHDFYTVKLDGATGDIIWQKNFNSTNGNDDITSATGIVVDPVGDLFVTGYTVADKNYDFQTIKYKKDNGNLLWQASFNGTAGKNDRPVGIALSPTGEVLVGGWTDTASNDLDVHVLKYDPGLLDPPTGVTAQAQSNTSTQLTWIDNSGNEDGFSIERCQGLSCSAFSEVGTVAAGVTTFTDNGLSPATYYSYRVRAFSGTSGYSHYSAPATTLTVVVTTQPPAESYVYNGLYNSDDYANAIAVGPDNNPVIAGQTNDFPVGYTSGVHSYDYLLTKLNRGNLSVVWSDRYNDPTDAADIATCVAVDSNNGIVVSGYATLFNGTSSDVNSLYTIRYPASGPPAIRGDQYNGPVAGGATDDRAVAVAIASASDSSNNSVVVGYGVNAVGNNDIYVLKYNADGTRAWAATPFDGSVGDDHPTSVVLALDGSIFVTGYSETAHGSNLYRIFTAKYNGTTGALVWSDLYAPVAGRDSRGYSLTLDRAGDLYVTGVAGNAAGNPDIFTIKYNGSVSTVQRVWERWLDGAAHADDAGAAVRIDPVEGSIVVAGTVASGAGDHDFAFVKYSPAGDVLAQKTYLRPASDETAKGLAIDSNGNTYITGNTGTGSSTDSLTVKFDYLGNINSATIYNGAANSFDESTGVVVNSMDEVFVAGYTEKATVVDNATYYNADVLVYKIAPDTSLPFTPYNFATTSTYATVTLTWLDRSVVKSGYHIERRPGACSTANTAPWQSVATVAAPALSFTDTGLNTGATYCYRINTYQSSGSASRWAEKEAVTLAPSAPGTLTAAAGSTTSVNLNWSDTTNGETGFRIDRCTGSDCTGFAPVGTTAANARTFTDTSVCNSTTYRYRVLAVGDGWESPASNIPAAVTTGTPAAPALTAARISEAEIQLSWTDPNSDESGHAVERCIGTGCTGFTRIASLPAGATQYRDNGLNAGTTYTYHIVAYKSAGCPWEKASNAAAATTTLVNPNGLTATATTTTSINLSWTDNTASETGYSIEKCIGDICGNFGEIAAIGPNSTSYTDTGACFGEKASYRVKAMRDAVTLSNSGDGCWTRRSPLTITGFQQNYQTRLTIPHDPDMLPGFDDLRFVDINAGIELPYWIESKTDSDSAVVWVKTGMNNTVYLYYGNATATSSSNGSAVFDFFDDFTGTSLNASRWNATGAATVADGALRVDTGSVVTLSPILSNPQGKVFEMKSQWLTGASSFSGLNIANAQSTQSNNAGSNALAYFVTDSGTTANLLTYGANGTAASYNIVTGSLSATLSTGGALYNPFLSNGQNTRKPAAGVWSPPGGGNITRIHVTNESEGNYDYLNVYNAAGTLLWRGSGSANTWLDIAPTSGIYTVFTTDGSVQRGVGGDVPEVVVTGSSATGVLNSYRIIGYDFQGTSKIGYFIKNLDFTETFRSSYAGTWNAAPYLWLGYFSGTAAGVTDIDDMMVDWVRVRTYAATEPTGTVGAKETSDCFTFGSPWSGTYTNIATAATGAPGTPVLTATKASEVQINLSWTDAAGDESGYKLERCTGNGCSNFTQIAVRNANVLTYSDTGLTPGATYTYRVKAFKSTTCAWETTSNTVIATTTITGPTTVTAVAADSTRVTLTWVNATTSETSFVIERCEEVGCTEFSSAGTASAHSTTFTDGTVCSGHTYTYRIKAINNLVPWESTPSASAAAVTPSYNNLLADPGFEKATTGWAAAVGTLTGTSFDTAVVKDGGRSMKLAATGASLGRAHSVTVTPGRSYVLSGWINASLTTGRAQCDVSGTGLDSPGIVAAAGTAQNNAGWVELSEVVTVPAGTSTVSVRCFADGTPNGTVYFDAISLAPETFVPVATRISEVQISLSWPDSATDETGYRIERCAGMDCTNFTSLTTVGANVTSYANSGLTANTTYRYRVQGYKTSSCSWDTTYSAVAETVTSPSAPTNLAATTPNTTQVTLTWTDTTASETGFEVERCSGAGCSSFARINTTGANATSFSDVTAASGTTYRYRVRALNSTAGWYSAYSGEVSATTPVPAAPVLTATAASEVAVSLTWTDPTNDETGYKVYRCGGAGCTGTDFSLVVSLGTNVTSYTDTGRSAGSSNTYYVQGYKTGSWTSDSNTASVTLTPAAPINLAVTAVDTTQTRLTWTNKTTSQTAISIERCQGAGCSTFQPVGTVGPTVTSFNDTTLCNNQPTSYRVQAINSTVPWSSAYSTTASITLAPPPAPTVLTATRTSEIQIGLSWTDNNSDETGFKIERCAGTGCTGFAQITTVLANVKTYNDTTVVPGTTYRYQVRAYKLPALGCGWDSAYTNAAEATAAILAPTNVVAAPLNSTSVKLTWTNNTVSETGYKIERCAGAGCSDFAETTALTGKATTWTDTTVASGTSYTYRIRATSTTAAWNSGYSNSSTAATPAQGAPSNLASTANTTRITLTWADNTVDENGFKIERCEGAGCDTFAQVAMVGTNVATWSDDSVCNGHSYSYRVRAYNTTVPYETPYSGVLTVVPPVPAPPVVTVSRGSEIALNLSWSDPTTDETGYRVESCPGADCTTFAPIGSTTGTTFTDTGLVPGSSYTYRIKGYKTAACSWETIGTPATGTTTITAPGALAAAAANTTRIDLSWTDSSATETGYKIERCTGPDCTDFRQVATAGTVTSWADTTVTAGTSYSYRVRATRNIPYAWDSGYSNTVSVATPATQVPGTLSAQQLTSSQIDLSWTDTATDETGYRVERCSGAGCANFAEIATTAANSAAYSSTGLASSTTYCFRVRSYKTGTSPWTSAYSNTACADTRMDAPETLTATPVNSFTVKLTWLDTSDGEGGFNIEQQVWNGEWVTVTSVGPNVTSHSDSIGIEPQKKYTYRIKAFRGAETSTYSNVVTVTTPAYQTGDATCDTPVSGAPVFTSQPVTTATEGVPFQYQATATAQGGGSISYLLTTKPQDMTISASGLISWTPGFDQQGERNVTIRATDSLGKTTDQNFSITVANIDRAPAFTSTAPTAAVTGHEYRYQAVASDPDGSVVTYALPTAPTGMTLSEGGLVSWVPGADQTGSHPVAIEASAGGVTTTQSFTVSVTANRAPTISSSPVTTAAEGLLYSYQAVASDADSDPLTYTLTTAPAGMTVSSGGLVTWAPSAAQIGANAVTLIVSDGSLSTTQTFTVTAAANHPPAITSTPATTGTEGTAYTYTVVASDSDGDAMTYTLLTPTAGMSLSPAGVLTWTPNYTQAGTYSLTIRVSEARSLYTDHSFTITIADTPRPPTISSTPPTSALIGQPYSYQVVATDPGGLAITYSLDTAPSGMTISGTGLVSWTPTVSGSYPVTIRTANVNYSSTQPYNLSVAAPPTVPTLIPQAGVNTDCATSTAHTLTWNAVTVPDADPAQYYVQLDTSNTFNSVNLKQSGWISGTSWTTPVIGNGTWYWRVKARDGVHAGAESAYSTAGSFSDISNTNQCGLCGFWDCSCDGTCPSSSCPLVYSYNGGYQYETDLQGPALSQIKKGSRYVYLYQPSYIVLENGLTPDVNNQYRVKIWESLQEASIIDEARLLALDYPQGYQIASSGAENTYYYGYSQPFTVYTLKDPILPVSVIDKHGNDVLAASSTVDNTPAPMDPDDPDNYYTIDFGNIQHPEYAKLVIDGWQDINSKIYLSTIQIQPYVELVDQNGQWVKVRNFGMPAGDLKAMVVDLSNLFLSSDHRIRLHLGIKKAQVWVFDRIRLDDSAPVPVKMQQLQATSADLQFGGHAIQSMVNRDHRLIATDEVQTFQPTWQGYGNFTRYGDILPLITQRDDKFALLNYADRLEITYPVPLPPQAGMTRGFVLMVDNYYKEFKDYKYLEPLPFHGMSDYPYPSIETYPTDEEHNLYRQLYNTRIVAP